MSPEEVQEFVASEFELDAASVQNALFEISARRAFSAASFFKAVEDGEGETLDALKAQKAVKLLAQEVFGIDWEEDLAAASLEELNRKANRLWEKSQFDVFIDRAIAAPIESAAPRAISSALSLSRSRLGELRDETNIRNKAILQEAEKLSGEISKLQEDLQILEQVRNHLVPGSRAASRGLARGRCRSRPLRFVAVAHPPHPARVTGLGRDVQRSPP